LTVSDAHGTARSGPPIVAVSQWPKTDSQGPQTEVR
jgi:hypothetical protein